MVKAEYPISFKLFGKDIFFKAPHPQKAESLMEVSLLDKSNKNKDERMRKSDRFMTKMNYEWRTFGETNSPQTIGVLILLFHIKKKFVILYMYC